MPTIKPNQDKYLALEKLLYRLAQGSPATLVYRTAILGFLLLTPGIQFPPDLAELAGGAGVNILRDILERLAVGEEISNEYLFSKIEIAQEDINKSVYKDISFNAFTRLLSNFLSEHQVVLQKIDEIVNQAISNNDYDRILVLDPETGELIVRKKGEYDFKPSPDSVVATSIAKDGFFGGESLDAEAKEESDDEFELVFDPVGGDLIVISQKDEVVFTSIFPKECKVETWSSLLVYAHLSSAIEKVRKDARNV